MTKPRKKHLDPNTLLGAKSNAALCPIFSDILGQTFDPSAAGHTDIIQQLCSMANHQMQAPAFQAIIERGDAIKASEVKRFFQLFSAGIQFAYEHATWEENAKHQTIIGIDCEAIIKALQKDADKNASVIRGLQLKHPKASSFVATNQREDGTALLAFTTGRLVTALRGSVKERTSEVTQDNRFGVRSRNEMIFKLGVEEGRHLCQYLNTELKDRIAQENHRTGYFLHSPEDRANLPYKDKPNEVDVDDFCDSHSQEMDRRLKAVNKTIYPSNRKR